MNIALCHFRVGETDGVSLEMEKWRIILERLGHKVYFVAGSQGSTQAHIIEELHYAHPENDKFVKNAYVALEDYTEMAFVDAVEDYAEIIENKLVKFIEENEIDVIVPNNIWSLGWGLPAGIGFFNAIKRTMTKCIVHHHDFYWEREKYSHPTCEAVHGMLDTYFPPRSPLIKHCVINNIAKEEMKIRKGIDATVVPNVFDFDVPLWTKDEYNFDLREKLGLKENDIFLLQATRIAERKAIEMAIDVAGKLKHNIKDKEVKLYDGREFDGQVVLVMVGLPESESDYIQKLKDKAKNYDLKLIFRNDIIEHSRSNENEKLYSLWDAYVDADFVTYPSILEGWGNQFLEAIFSKKPILVYEYPVYVTDIKPHDFDVVSLGSSFTYDENRLVRVDQDIVDAAALEVERLLTDAELRDKVVNKNFEIAKSEFSYQSLLRILEKIFI
ncbi:glycosyltransferase family 4 protein [Acidaminobacter sp. JC074]|uniref:glycosyltransferase family 4 protein n=1 Tax=Acidaminobacter sp. JC074 TaxID=2530199 RepID=UPI001F102B92|nr:glycosyltransferase family 4 protein [Acidaminobacter sp. JC074]MCH4888016.1 glycosyltransferase family 4 protein [Acidaminobacter sp. JC074]